MTSLPFVRDKKQLDLVARFSYNMERLIGKNGNCGAIAVAVSGGSDSLALTFLLNDWLKSCSGELVAITVDHQLRQESTNEACQIASVMQKANIEHHTLVWGKKKVLGNIQSQAREARYKLMSDFCKQRGIGVLFVGHTLEDQAETVLLRLFRGSGLDGLSAIQPFITMNDINIMRPLLDLKRKELQLFLSNRGYSWISDISNEDKRFMRVQVRDFIAQTSQPELLVKRLAKTAQHLSRSKDFIEQMVNYEMDHIIDFRDEGFCVIDYLKYQSVHKEIALRLLSIALQRISGKFYKPRFICLERLWQQIINSDVDQEATLYGCFIQVKIKKRLIFVFREISAISENVQIKDQVIWDNRFICELEETLRNEDVSVGAVGKEGYDYLRTLQVLPKENPVSKYVIYSLPAFRILETIVAVPHIQYYKSKVVRESCSSKFINGG